MKLSPPEGYEIDKENSTFEEIVFKKIENKIPNSWYDIEYIEGYYVNAYSEVTEMRAYKTTNENKNIFSNEEIAKASVAIAQLSHLRDIARDGWKPDWSELKSKNCIFYDGDDIIIAYSTSIRYFLSFQTEEIANEFLMKYENLIMEAKPILGG